MLTKDGDKEKEWYSRKKSAQPDTIVSRKFKNQTEWIPKQSIRVILIFNNFGRYYILHP
jgi:hypothetical protein